MTKPNNLTDTATQDVEALVDAEMLEVVKRIQANALAKIKLKTQAPKFSAQSDGVSYSIGVNATHVFIDDIRGPGDVKIYGMPDNKTWHVCKNYAEFEDYLNTHALPEFVSFDFNLGPGKTGHDCAKLLVQHCLEHNIDKLPDHLYHGDLESGRIIENYLMFWGKHKRVYKAKHVDAQAKIETPEGKRKAKKR